PKHFEGDTPCGLEAWQCFIECAKNSADNGRNVSTGLELRRQEFVWIRGHPFLGRLRMLFYGTDRRNQTRIEERPETLPELFGDFLAHFQNFPFKRLLPRIACRFVLRFEGSQRRSDSLRSIRHGQRRMSVRLPPKFVERLPRRAFHSSQRFCRFRFHV